jgi:hypothetical protein
MCSKRKYGDEYMAVLTTEISRGAGFNRELHDLFKDPRLSAVIIIDRLRWAGHIAKMDEICMPRRHVYATRRIEGSGKTALQVER